MTKGTITVQAFSQPGLVAVLDGLFDNDMELALRTESVDMGAYSATLSYRYFPDGAGRREVAALAFRVCAGDKQAGSIILSRLEVT